MCDPWNGWRPGTRCSLNSSSQNLLTRLQEYQKSLIGDPVKDRKVYEDDSPITFIRQAKAPLLVLQGDNDIRVPKEEAVQIVDILEKAGTVVAAHYYPNEGRHRHSGCSRASSRR
jgi:dipeptidyl aminopeptidase/acylaminoacyl peptidase